MRIARLRILQHLQSQLSDLVRKEFSFAFSIICSATNFTCVQNVVLTLSA